MSITVEKLVKRYHSQIAVNQISFGISKGEIVGFLGPNGAGKSTTMKIITGFLAADGGKVTVCGHEVSSQSLLTKSKIGYLPESNPLYLDMYVKEYLQFIANIHHLKNKKEAVNNIITTTGLTPEANKKIGQLSKGYKQRVGLAAALIHNPEVLILDEPTSGLDPNQIVEIRALIKQMGADKTVLFSSHILQEVEALCDRIIVINKGNIVADDQLNNLMQGSRNNELTLHLKEAVQYEIFEGVGQVTQLNAYTWSFSTADVEGLKRKIMQIALDKNLNIVSWESKLNNTLEDIFRTLTN